MTRHILVVDDDFPLLGMYRAILEEEGYQVSLFHKPFEDLAEVERLHPDLLILDVRMHAEADGLTLFEQLRSYPPTHSLPILLCTAASFKNVRERVEALREQGVPVVYKPFDVEAFLRVIQEALRNDEET